MASDLSPGALGLPCPGQCPPLSPLGAGSWLRAAAWQPVAGGGRRGWCGVTASPEGPPGCVLSKRSGLMSATCETNFGGAQQPNHPPLGGKQDPGVLVSPIWKMKDIPSGWEHHGQLKIDA